MRNRANLNPLVHSLNDRNSQGYARPKPRAFSLCPMWVQGPNHLGYSMLSSQVIQQGSWVLEQHPREMLVPQVAASSLCHSAGTMIDLLESSFLVTFDLTIKMRGKSGVLCQSAWL